MSQTEDLTEFLANFVRDASDYSKVSGISGFGYKRKGWCQICVPGISVRGGVGRPGCKRRARYPVPGISVDQGFPNPGVPSKLLSNLELHFEYPKDVHNCIR